MTDTIHAALEEVARRAALRRLAEWDFSHLPPDWLERSRGTDDEDGAAVIELQIRAPGRRAGSGRVRERSTSFQQATSRPVTQSMELLRDAGR